MRNGLNRPSPMKTFRLLFLAPCFALLTWAETPTAASLPTAKTSALSAPPKATAPVVVADPAAIDALLNALHFDESVTRLLTMQKQMSLKYVEGTLAQSSTKHLSPSEQSALAQKSVDTAWAGVTPEAFHAVAQRIYSQSFTTEEARAIVTFLNSPAGHALAAKQPQAQRQVMSDITPSVREAMQKVKQTIADLSEPADKASKTGSASTPSAIDSTKSATPPMAPAKP